MGQEQQEHKENEHSQEADAPSNTERQTNHKC